MLKDGGKVFFVLILFFHLMGIYWACTCLGDAENDWNFYIQDIMLETQPTHGGKRLCCFYFILLTSIYWVDPSWLRTFHRLFHFISSTCSWGRCYDCPHFMGKWGTGRLINLPRILQLVKGGPGNPTEAVWFQNYCLALEPICLIVFCTSALTCKMTSA